MMLPSRTHEGYRIYDALTYLGQARYLTTFYLAGAFWHVLLKEEDGKKQDLSPTLDIINTNTSPLVKYHDVRGNATAKFQRLMSNTLTGMEQTYGALVLCYVDHILSATTTIDQSIKRMKYMFSSLNWLDLKIKADKYSFMKKSIGWLPGEKN